MPVTPLTSKLEFTICKEAASIAITATELATVHQLLTSHIPKAEFRAALDKVILPLVICYQVPVYVLQPLFTVKTESDFVSGFEAAHEQYKNRLDEKSGIPRQQVEESYEAWLLLAQTKEAGTSFPILRRTFDRLLNFIDKYVDNDSWLLMNIDNIYKMLSLLLAEIAELKAKDPEEAWLTYDQAMAAVLPFMNIINDRTCTLAEISPATLPLAEVAVG